MGREASRMLIIRKGAQFPERYPRFDMPFCSATMITKDDVEDARPREIFSVSQVENKSGKSKFTRIGKTREDEMILYTQQHAGASTK